MTLVCEERYEKEIRGFYQNQRSKQKKGKKRFDFFLLDIKIAIMYDRIFKF